MPEFSLVRILDYECRFLVIPRFVQNGLTQNVKTDQKKKFHRSLQTLQLLPMCRCKYTSKADFEPRGLCNFCETLLVFEDPEARNRMRNKRDIEILMNACFSALNDAKGLMSVEQSIKSKTSQGITSDKASHNDRLSWKQIQKHLTYNSRAIVSISS